MKRLVFPLIAIAVAALIMFNLYGSGQEARAELARQESLAEVERYYHERIALVRSQPDPEAYQRTVNAFLGSYFTQLDNHTKAYGGGEVDAYLKELESRGGDEASYDARRKAYEDVKAVYTMMREGTYAPLWTGTDKGVRMDLLPGRITHMSGEPTLVLPVVLWGAQREVLTTKAGKTMAASATHNLKVKLFDARDRAFGELDGGDPSERIDHPERFIAGFPPQVILGKYNIPLFPAEVQRAEISFGVTTSTSYGAAPVHAQFEWKLELPPEWKLRPGESWEGAQISERSAEEIGGR